MANERDQVPNPLSDDGTSASLREMEFDGRGELQLQAESRPTTSSDVEAAFRGMKAGNISEGEAVAVMEAWIDGKLNRSINSKLKAAFTAEAAGGLLDAAIKSTVARLTEAPAK